MSNISESNNFEIASQNDWREKFLRNVLIITCIISPVILITAFPLVSGTLPLAASHVVAYLLLLAFTFLPIPYAWRATGMLLIVYAIGAITLLGWGPFSDGTLFFLTAILLGCLFFDFRIGIIINVVSTLTVFIAGWLVINGYSTLTVSPEPGDWYVWTNYAVDLLAVGGVLTFGLYTLKKDGDNANKKGLTALDALLNERNTLEERVYERTYGLAKKTEYLRSISLISSDIASIQDITSLLNKSVQLIAEQFNYYHVAIFSINTHGDQIILEAASSDGGKKLLGQGYRLDIKSEYPITNALRQKSPYIAHDVGDYAESFSIKELPNTRSELALPFIARGKMIGILDIHSTEARAFDKEDLDIFASLADHIAAAIDNVNLLNETQTVLTQLEAVTNTNTSENWKKRLEKKQHVYTYTPLGLRPEKNIEIDDSNILVVPIILRGFQIGSISMSRKNAIWRAEEKDLALKIAGQVSLAADNLRLVEEAQANAIRDQTISSVSSKIRETLDIDAVILSAVNEFQKAMNLKEVEIRLGAPDSPRKKDLSRSRYTGSLSLKDRKG